MCDHLSGYGLLDFGIIFPYIFIFLLHINFFFYIGIHIILNLFFFLKTYQLKTFLFSNLAFYSCIVLIHALSSIYAKKKICFI